MDPCKTVLIVEDDEGIRETMKLALELRGYSAVLASNGQEALNQLKLIPRPCLILLDLMMPVMDGRGFVSAVALAPDLANIPIVVVTAFGDRVEGLKVNMVIPKPLALERLYHTVQQYCGDGDRIQRNA